MSKSKEKLKKRQKERPEEYLARIRALVYSETLMRDRKRRQRYIV